MALIHQKVTLLQYYVITTSIYVKGVVYEDGVPNVYKYKSSSTRR